MTHATKRRRSVTVRPDGVVVEERPDAPERKTGNADGENWRRQEIRRNVDGTVTVTMDY
jgi:hypothetical protein